MFKYKFSKSDVALINGIKTFCSEYVVSYKDIGMNQKDNGAFSFAPLLLYDHIKTLFLGFKYLQSKKTSIKFLDVGCGTGNVMAMAKSFGADEIKGIEINMDLKKYTKTSIVNNVFYEDAMDFKYYDSFNYIYFLRPFVGEKDMLNLFRTIVDRTSKNTIILSIGYIDWYTVDYYQLDRINNSPPIILLKQ